jgi:anaerobic selenocysteine-containing dehydrogenase
LPVPKNKFNPAVCDSAGVGVLRNNRHILEYRSARVNGPTGGQSSRRRQTGSVDDSLTYPLENIGDPGQPIIFTDGFPTSSGKGKFVPAEFIHADELPEEHYPLVFISGRKLEYWHTASMRGIRRPWMRSSRIRC